MRTLVIVLTLVCLSCRISPVITVPDEDVGGSRYSACKRAAKDYCRDVVGASSGEMKSCVSDSTFSCLSGGAQ